MKKINELFLSDRVFVNEQFARSARIDCDDISNSGFIYSQSIDNFLKVLASHRRSAVKQGAFTWTGPYGSGKSTLALSFSSVLVKDLAHRTSASQSYNKDTVITLWNAFNPGANGWKTLNIVGDTTSLEELLKNNIKKAFPKFSKPLDTSNNLLDALDDISNADPDGGGLLIIVDELGKLLEGLSRNSSRGDLIFYQEIGERAARSNGRLVFIGILHQSFQDYAGSIKSMRDEWGKVHGRFVDVSINLSSEEQLELIASAINSNDVTDKFERLADDAIELLKLKNRAPSENLKKLFLRSWPLNPLLSLSLGPISKRSYGQNQRSIFSFLGGNEPSGLQDFLRKTKLDDAIFYNIDQLWDYLNINWGSSIAGSADSHHFANVKESLSRLEVVEEANELQVQIIKAISIIELTSSLTGLNASAKTLQVALDLSTYKLNKALSTLIDNSIIIFKKFKDSYSLYEGSDFDIETALENAKKSIKHVNLSSVFSSFLNTEVVAKRHYLETGNLRWAEIKICTKDEFESVVLSFSGNQNRFGLFILVIDGDQSDLKEFQISTRDNSNICLGSSSISESITAYAHEYLGLQRIIQTSKVLLQDKVARREVRDRIDAVRAKIEDLLNISIENATWVMPDGRHPANAHQLTQIASQLAGKHFAHSPIFNNELINRSKPSGSAVSGLKQLLYRMVSSEQIKNLGILKFPAERGLYESLLKANLLHAEKNGQYSLINPAEMAEDEDLANLKPIWLATTKFLKENTAKSVDLIELHEIWGQPPFGVKAGLFPFFSLLYALTCRSNISFYREGIFSTNILEIDVDYIIRTPKLVQFRWVDMSADTKALLSNLAKIPEQIAGVKIDSIEPLDVAKSLISLFDKIDPFAKRTVRISENAKKIRAIFKRASDPTAFTLNELPALYSSSARAGQKPELDYLIHQLSDGLLELRSVYNNVLTRLRDHTLSQLGIFTITEQTLAELNARGEKTLGISGDLRQEGFINRLRSLTTELVEFEAVVSLAVGKPPRMWIDSDVDKAFVEITNFCRNFINLETMAELKGLTNSRYSFAVVAHSAKVSGGVQETFELDQIELDDALELSKSIQALLISGTHKNSRKQLLAALTLLATEK